jgi:hypothetical protein
MSDEYVRKQDAIDAIRKAENHAFNSFYKGLVKAHEIVADLSPADVVPVVRCKECKFRENDDFCTGRGFPYQLVPDDGFCDKGERKE